MLKEASMNISMTGNNSREVQELVRILQNAGLDSAHLVTDMDINQLMPSEEDHMCPACAAAHTMDTPCGEAVEEEYANSPEEEYQDDSYMLQDLSGGLNRKKDKGALRAKDPAITYEQKLKAQLKKNLYERYQKLDELGWDDAVSWGKDAVNKGIDTVSGWFNGGDDQQQQSEPTKNTSRSDFKAARKKSSEKYQAAMKAQNDRALAQWEKVIQAAKNAPPDKRYTINFNGQDVEFTPEQWQNYHEQKRDFVKAGNNASDIGGFMSADFANNALKIGAKNKDSKDVEKQDQAQSQNVSDTGDNGSKDVEKQDQAPETPAPDQQAAEEPPAEEPPAPDQQAPETPAPDQQAAEEPPAPDQQAAEEPPAEEPPAPDQQAAEEPPAPDQQAAEEPPAPDQQAAEEPPAEEPPAEEPPAEEPPAPDQQAPETPAPDQQAPAPETPAPKPTDGPPPTPAPETPAPETPAPETQAKGGNAARAMASPAQGGGGNAAQAKGGNAAQAKGGNAARAMASPAQGRGGNAARAMASPAQGRGGNAAQAKGGNAARAMASPAQGRGGNAARGARAMASSAQGGGGNAAQAKGGNAAQISPQIQNVSKKIVDYLKNQGLDANGINKFFSSLIG